MQPCESRAEPRESTRPERNLAERRTKHPTNRGWNLANRGRNVAKNLGRIPTERRAEHRESTNRGQNFANGRRDLADNRGRNLAEQNCESGLRMEPQEWRAEFRDESRAEFRDLTNRLATYPRRNLESTAFGEPEIGTSDGPRPLEKPELILGKSKIVVRAPWGSRGLPELSQNRPRAVRERPKSAQEHPIAPQERPKTRLRATQERPRGP